jgi:cell division protein FtsB
VQKRKAVGLHRRRSLRKLTVAVCIVICLFGGAVTLYPALRDSYLSDREVRQREGELAAVEARNAQIAAQIAALQTPEGIQDRAREQLGMVMNGEAAVNITGLSLTTSSTALPDEIPRGLIVEEAAWWTGFLDALFAVPEPPEPVELDNPFSGNP